MGCVESVVASAVSPSFFFPARNSTATSSGTITAAAAMSAKITLRFSGGAPVPAADDATGFAVSSLAASYLPEPASNDPGAACPWGDDPGAQLCGPAPPPTLGGGAGTPLELPWAGGAAA
jgi:hypothetical protein